MFDLFAQDELYIFSILALIVVGLLLLQIVLMLMGISTDIGDSDIDMGADLGFDPAAAQALGSLDIDPSLAAEIEPDFGADIDAADIGWISTLGLNQAPTMIWLAGLLSFVAMFGFMIQGGLMSLGMPMLPGWVATLIVAGPALFCTARFARILGRIVPSIETSAISERAFHQRKGRISGGTAAQGRPAEVEWTDGYGSRHYLLAEPLDPNDRLVQGQEVLIVRTREGLARLLPLS